MPGVAGELRELRVRQPQLRLARRAYSAARGGREQDRVVGRERDAHARVEQPAAADGPPRARRRPCAGCSSARRRGSCPPRPAAASAGDRRPPRCRGRAGRAAARRAPRGPTPRPPIPPRARRSAGRALARAGRRRRRPPPAPTFSSPPRPKPTIDGSGSALVEIQDAIRGFGSPVAHARRAGCGRGCRASSRDSWKPTSIASRQAAAIQADPREDLGRDVDLGVAQPVRPPASPPRRAPPRRSPRDRGRGRRLRRRAAGSSGASRTERRADSKAARSAKGCPRACGQARDLRGGQTALEVKVAVREERCSGRRRGGLSARSHRFPQFTHSHRALSTHNPLVTLYAREPGCSRSFSTCSSARRSPTSPASPRPRSSGACSPGRGRRSPGSGSASATAATAALPAARRRRRARPAVARARDPVARRRRPPGAWGSIRRNLPLLIPGLEPLRRLARPSGRGGRRAAATGAPAPVSCG